MAQTGTIYGYHDGNTYSLANIYDEKLNEYNILAGTSAKNIISVSFNTETGVDYYFDSDAFTDTSSSSARARVAFIQSSTGIAFSASATKPITKIIPYLSNEHIAEWALKFNGSTQYFVIGQQASYSLNYANTATPVTWILIPLAKDAGGNYINAVHPSYEVEGVVFVDTSKYNKSYYRNSVYTNLRPLYSIPATHNVNGTTSHFRENILAPSYDLTNDDTPASFYIYADVHDENYTYVRELDHNFFDEPFHFRLQFFNSIDNPNYVYLCYINGELLFYKKRPANFEETLYRYYCWDHIVIGGYSQYVNNTKHYGINHFENLHVQNFKVSLLSPVYQKVNIPSNMLIRHNDANHYIPLTTSAANTSVPYIAVRHGNTNFYTIK